MVFRDVIEEHKLSESATALATARVSTSDDEDGSTQGKKKFSIHSNTHITHSDLLAEIDNLGTDASYVTVPSGHHGDETRDGRCGTRVSSLDGSRTSEGHDGLVVQEDIDPKKEYQDTKNDSTSEVKQDVSDNGENKSRQTHSQKLETNLDETSGNEVATGDKAREVITDILIQPNAAVALHHESVSDQDEENQMQNEDPILEEEYLLKCLYCETTSTRSTLLRDHMRNQHSDKPIRYQCPKCEQTFLLKSHLDKHLAMHSPTSQSCKVCQKTFANVYRLQRHMISHSESTDLRKFKCPECGKAFKFKHHLKEHIRIHSGEKPFQCPTCNKRFSHSGSYSSHMTSKKCWVIGQSKGHGRRQERQIEAGTVREIVSTHGHCRSGSETSDYMYPVGQMYTQPLTSLTLGAYPQQLLKFDQPPPATLRQQFFCNPPITTAMMTSAQNAFAFGLYKQKLSGTSSVSSSTVPPVPAHVHQNTNIPFHMMSSSHSIPEAHVSHMTLHSPALVDALMAGHYRGDSRTVASNPTAENSNISLPTPSPSPCGLQSSPADTKGRGTDIADRMVLNLEENGHYTEDLMKLVHKQKVNLKEEVKEKTPDVKEEVLSEEEEDKTKLKSSEENKEVKEESACEDISDLIVGEAKLEMKPVCDGDVQVCRYCQQQFTSPVDLHQHERYLCEDNHDIKKVISDSRTLKDKGKEDGLSLKCEVDTSSPVSSKLSDEETEDMEDEDDEDEDDDDISDSNRCSKLTENQAQHLRGCFRDNKKPSDHAMEEIAKIIGASKKMVQIWFQSARSREKRKKSQCKSKPTIAKVPNKRCTSSVSSVTSPSSYIPIVPNPFAVMGKHYQKLSPAPVNYPNTGPLTPPSDEQPLDLSVRKQTPPKAHENHPVQFNSMENFQDQVLNLSNKVPKPEPVSPSLSVKLESPNTSSTSRCSSQESTPKCYSSSLPLSIPNFLHIPDPHRQFPHPVVMVTDLDGATKHMDGRFQHSEIFKYMSQKGLFKSGFPTILDPSTSRKFSPTLLNSNVLSQITGVIPPNNHHPQRESPVKVNSTISMDTTVNKNNDKSPSSPSTHKLIIDESLEEHKTKVSNLEGEMKRYLEGQGNLQTLASVASLEEFRAAAEAEGKRKRKKSSKQVEAEEITMDDLDDSVSNTDDDSTSPRKRRRSWKGHRMNEELGMYACDQCDKQFSKQSSLARHKYEHSGARPFNCEVCSKAFKHKHHLTEHRRLHSGEKPFKCRKCGKRFSHSGSYSQHMNHRYKFCKPSDGEDEDVAIVSSKED